jgi:hypothetical protein
MTTENLFELASRKKLRFQSAKGELTVEQLWDLPLISKSPTRDVKCDLDTLARDISRELKAQAEDSFVETKTNPEKARLELALELVKYVIGVKIEQRDNAEKDKERRVERERLLNALERSQEKALEELTPEQIQEKLKQLG